VIVSIKDEGAGFGDIDPDILFDKYKQVDLKKDNKYRGVGLGLYFCRLAITAMGGSTWAEKRPGDGACFKFSLSIAD
jgi:K+-sensing histidine kinase KdpD